MAKKIIYNITACDWNSLFEASEELKEGVYGKEVSN